MQLIFNEDDFRIGERLYLITDPEQYERMVIKLSFGTEDEIMYGLAIAAEISWHYAIEMSRERAMVTT